MSPLEVELTTGRPEPSAGLVDSIVALVRPRAVGSSRLRLGYAGLVTAAMVGVLAATGGLAYAASAVHLTSSRPTHASPASAACSQYAQAPIVNRVSPTKGKVGHPVTIKGQNFSGNSKVTSVTFGAGKSASFRVVNGSTIKTSVPKGAKTGPITVRNCAGSATSPKFTVTKK